jgi:hypothetical protein
MRIFYWNMCYMQRLVASCQFIQLSFNFNYHISDIQMPHYVMYDTVLFQTWLLVIRDVTDTYE